MNLEENVEKKSTPARGNVKVQLFDTNGNLVEEQENHNFIAKGMDYLYTYVMAGLFKTNKLTSSYNFNLNDIIPYIDPFKYMFLTDADHDTDPENELYMLGNVVGKASSDTLYVGSSATLGTINQSESYIDEDTVHLVYDFATNAANGTINSVYFSANDGSNIDSLFGNSNFDQSFNDIPYTSSTSNANVISYIPNHDVYVIYRSLYFYIYDNSYTLLKTLSAPSFPSSYGSYRSSVFTDDSLYIMSRRTSGGVSRNYAFKFDIYDDVLNLPDGSTVGNATVSTVVNNLFKSFDEGVIRDTYSVTYAPSINTIILHTNNTLYKFDTDWNIIDAKPSDTVISGSLFMIDDVYAKTPAAMGSYTDKQYRTRSALINTHDLSILPLGGISMVGVMGVNKDYDWIYAGLSTAASTRNLRYPPNGAIVPKYNISSRAKLPAPIIKTDQYVMKVSYTFRLPSIYDA